MKKLTTTKATDLSIYNNLKSWVMAAAKEDIYQGKFWYADAQVFCMKLSLKYNIDSYKCAAVVSCLSPNNKWKRNKIDAVNVIEAFLNGLSADDVKVCTYNANKIKAFSVLNGALISEKSPKTHAFSMNVGLLSASHITIDKWHLRACVLTPSDGIMDCAESCTIVQYRRIEKITAQLAQELGLKGYELQAIIWITIKRIWNR
jgi:hypothetical protein